MVVLVLDENYYSTTVKDADSGIRLKESNPISTSLPLNFGS